MAAGVDFTKYLILQCAFMCSVVITHSPMCGTFPINGKWTLTYLYQRTRLDSFASTSYPQGKNRLSLVIFLSWRFDQTQFGSSNTDATFMQCEGWREMKQLTDVPIILEPNLSQPARDKPHSSHDPCYLGETDWIWSSGGEMRLAKWAKAQRWHHKHLQ